jgi:uncharacterized protein (DUF1501 family)
MKNTTLSRRTILKAGGASAAALSFAGNQAAAQMMGGRKKRVFALYLAGGADGVSMVIPKGDPGYQSGNRPRFEEPLPLDSTFGLNSRFKFLHTLWQKKELAVVHATGCHDANRSHFETQKLVFYGIQNLADRLDGWLYRSTYQQGQTNAIGLSLTPAVHDVVSGTATPYLSWTNNYYSADSLAYFDAIKSTFDSDDSLKNAFLKGQSNYFDLMKFLTANGKGAPGGGSPLDLARTAGRALAPNNGYSVAVMALGDFDTHAGHVNRLANDGVFSTPMDAGYNKDFYQAPSWRPLGNYGHIDAIIYNFKKELGEAAWKDTLVYVFTEFGRTAFMNGSGGTDHGRGGVAFIIGGSVNGGKVYGDWPGVAEKQLQDARDLKVTTDIRSINKQIAYDWLGATKAEQELFPNSQSAPKFNQALFR